MEYGDDQAKGGNDLHRACEMKEQVDVCFIWTFNNNLRKRLMGLNIPFVFIRTSPTSQHLALVQGMALYRVGPNDTQRKQEMKQSEEGKIKSWSNSTVVQNELD